MYVQTYLIITIKMKGIHSLLIPKKLDRKLPTHIWLFKLPSENFRKKITFTLLSKQSTENIIFLKIRKLYIFCLHEIVVCVMK